MDDRAQALADIANLAQVHGLSLEDIATVVRPGSGAPADHHARAVLVRVLTYLGVTFVFAGIAIFVSMQWDALNSAARVVITLGPGIVALALAVIGVRDHRFERASTPLFLIAGLLEPTGMMVGFAEFGSGGDWRWASFVTCGVMTAQWASLFMLLRRSTLLFFTLLFGALFWWTSLDLVGMSDRGIALVVGAAVVLASVGLDRGGHRDITAPWYFAGTVAFLWGYFDTVDRTAAEVSFLAVAAVFVYASTALASRTMLFVATLSILAYTGVFTNRHFADSIGWPISLMLFGAFMIGLSAVAVRIDRRYIRGS